MLGRYIGGTLLVLGGAMLLAPDASERDEAAGHLRADHDGIVAPAAPAGAAEAGGEAGSGAAADAVLAQL